MCVLEAEMGTEVFSGGGGGVLGMKLSAHVHLVSNIKSLRLYLHFTIRLRGVHTGANLYKISVQNL